MTTVPDASIAAEVDAVPLCVDLDGTLVGTDSLYEAFFALLKRRPLLAVRFPLWLSHGRAFLKARVAEALPLDPRKAPYAADVVDFVHGEKAQGRTILLVTGADERVARGVADHLGLFDQVMASDGITNLSGRRKAEALRRRFGPRGFDYIGNCKKDLSVWRQARTAHVVTASDELTRKAAGVSSIGRVFARQAAGLEAWFGALRMHQWLKNLLVFVPLLAGHALFDASALAASILAFLSYSLLASGTYVINDLCDLGVDRDHPSKRRRPLASGRLLPSDGIRLAGGLVALALLLGLFLPWSFCLVLALYFAATLSYSLRLKQAMLIDVVLLAGLYTLRILAGSAATGIPLSSWLLAFSMFLFFSLALVKRYSELFTSEMAGGKGLSGRGYRAEDVSTVVSLGAASGFVAVLVLVLYINSEVAAGSYSRPALLWIPCVGLLYWISRAWMVVARREMHDDPLIWAARDQLSRWTIVICVAAVATAI